MNGYLLAASVLVAATGAAHSVLGESVILRHLAKVHGFPRLLGEGLPRRTMRATFLGGEDFPKRTIRAGWHVATVLGWGLSAVLARYAQRRSLDPDATWAIRAMAVTFLACALLFLAGTRLRHPGWLAFLVMAALCWAGAAGP